MAAPERFSFLAYHEQSSAQGYHLRNPRWTSSAHWPAEWTEIEHKTYQSGSSKQVATQSAPDDPVAHTIRTRRSVRANASEPLLAATLGELLNLTLGAYDVAGTERRAYPTPGGLCSLEAYCLTLRCDGLERGIHHFDPVAQSLSQTGQPLPAEAIEQAFASPWIVQSRAIVVLTTVWTRLSKKCGERAYRYALLEAGHAAQTLILAAHARDVNVVPVGGFCDAQLGRLLGLGRQAELPLYGLVFP